MIIEKTFVCSTKNVDEVFLEVAEEIKNGWRVVSIKHDLPEMSVCSTYYPTFTITLNRRDNDGRHS